MNEKKPLLCSGISKKYKVGGSVVHALKAVDFEVNRGDLISIMGPSGSGKSTLLHIAGTLDRPDNGKVFVDGQDVTHVPEGRLSVVRREKIGFVFQFFNLATQLTAVENVGLPMLLSKRYASSEANEKARIFLGLVGLPESRFTNTPSQLSGGQQQMVAIARALANGPVFVLADEPTGNLDVDSSSKVMRLIRSLNSILKVAFVTVTHNPEVAAHARTVKFMRDGELLNAAPEPFASAIRAAQRGKVEASFELGGKLTSLFELEERVCKRRFVDGEIAEEELVGTLQRLERMRG